MNRIKTMNQEKKEPEILSFESRAKWRKWLSGNYSRQEGIWLRFYKKSSGIGTVRPTEAVDEALCFGWIDGQAKPYDETSWLVRYTPRRKRSIWSKRNRENVERLTREGRMAPQGQAEVERAKSDGRWESAYDSPKEMKVPKDFLDALKEDKEAYDFYKTLNKTNTYAIAMRLQTAKKPETRERRMNQFLEMMKNRKKLY